MFSIIQPITTFPSLKQSPGHAESDEADAPAGQGIIELQEGRATGFLRKEGRKEPRKRRIDAVNGDSVHSATRWQAKS